MGIRPLLTAFSNVHREVQCNYGQRLSSVPPSFKNSSLPPVTSIQRVRIGRERFRTPHASRREARFLKPQYCFMARPVNQPAAPRPSPCHHQQRFQGACFVYVGRGWDRCEKNNASLLPPLTVDSSPPASSSSSAASRDRTLSTAPSSLGLRACEPHSPASSCVAMYSSRTATPRQAQREKRKESVTPRVKVEAERRWCRCRGVALPGDGPPQSCMHIRRAKSKNKDRGRERPPV